MGVCSIASIRARFGAFFQRRGLHTQFFRFWRSSANSKRAKFHRTWKRFAEELKRSADE